MEQLYAPAAQTIESAEGDDLLASIGRLRLEASVDSKAEEDPASTAVSPAPPAGSPPAAVAPLGVACPATSDADPQDQQQQQQQTRRLTPRGSAASVPGAGRNKVPSPGTAPIAPPAQAQLQQLQQQQGTPTAEGAQEPLPALDDSNQFPSLQESKMLAKSERKRGSHSDTSPTPSPRQPQLQQGAPGNIVMQQVVPQAAQSPQQMQAAQFLGAQSPQAQGQQRQIIAQEQAIAQSSPRMGDRVDIAEPAQHDAIPGGRPKPMLGEFMPGGHRPSSRDQQQHFGETESEEQPSRVLWVGNVGGNVTQQMLFEEFSVYGHIETIKMLPSKICAFVNFSTVESAARAREALHGKIIGGQPIRVKFRKRQEQSGIDSPGRYGSHGHGSPMQDGIGGGMHETMLNPVSRAVWVGNIGDDVQEAEFRRVAGQFGDIESVKFLRSKMCAFVNYMSEQQAIEAVRGLQGQRIGGMTVRANFGKPMPLPGASPLGQAQQQMGPPPGFYSPYGPMHPAMQQQRAMPYMTLPQGVMPAQMPFFMWGADGMAPPGAAPPGYPIPIMPGQPAPFIFPAAEPCQGCGAAPQQKVLMPCNHGVCDACLSRARQTRPAICPACNSQVAQYTDYASVVGFPFWYTPAAL
eukprot:m51a1_g5964 putative related to jsn1-rna-binding protein (pumilio family) (633) ;mRNA; f:171073-173644